MTFKKRIDSSSVDVYESMHRFFKKYYHFLWLEIVTEILESAQQRADSCEHTSLSESDAVLLNLKAASVLVAP